MILNGRVLRVLISNLEASMWVPRCVGIPISIPRSMSISISISRDL